MGSYTSFSVDGYQLLSSKSYVDADVMTVFTEAEKSIREVRQSGSEGDANTDGNPAEEYLLTEVSYAVSGSTILERLEVMGFTLRATRSVFEEGIRREILDTQESLPVHESIADVYAEEIRLLQLLSFDVWLESFRSLKGNDLNSWDLTLKERSASESSTRVVVAALLRLAFSTVALRIRRGAAVSRAVRDQPQHIHPSSSIEQILRATRCEATAAGLRDTAALRGRSQACGICGFAAQCLA